MRAIIEEYNDYILKSYAANETIYRLMQYHLDSYTNWLSSVNILLPHTRLEYKNKTIKIVQKK